MSRKYIQIVSILFLGIAAGFLGGYLFKQSSKLKEVNRIVTPPKNATMKSKPQKTIEEKSKIFKKDVLASITKSDNGSSLKNEETISKNMEKKSNIKKWITEYIITPYFIEDLVEFILNNYQLAGTEHNPTDKPKLTISLRALNARYGMELVGFKIEAPSLEKARKKILQKIMDPDLLKSQYDHFIEMFINELIESAQETVKVFREDGKLVERQLTKEQIKTLLILVSDYVDNLSKVLTTISEDSHLLTKLDNYLKEEAKSMHYNFILNQITNNYKMEMEKLNGNTSDKVGRERILAELKKKRELALKNYEISIKRRERLRTKIIDIIRKRNPGLSFNSSEILYICEWVHRRIAEGQSLEKIKQIATIFNLAAEQMRQRAMEL